MPPRLLRIGLVRDGNLVSERHIPSPLPITLGPEDCTLPADLPDPHTLIRWEGDQAVLMPLKGMRGRLSVDGTGQSLKSDAPTRLTDGDRGKLQLGEITILFRFADAPLAPQGRLQDLDFRPRLFEPDDRRLAASLALFAALGSMIATTAYHAPPMQLDAPIELPSYPQVTIVVPPPPTPAPTPGPTETPPTTSPRGPGSAPATAVAKALPAPKPTTRPESKLAKRIGTTGKSLLAPISQQDVFHQGLEGKFDTVARSDVAGALTHRSAQAVQGLPGDRHIGEVRAGEVDRVRIAAAPVVDIKPVVEAREPKFDGPVAGLAAVLRGRSGRFKRCYESVLKLEPNLGGRVVLAWSIEAERTREARVVEHTTGSRAFTDCLVKALARWRFDGIEDGDVQQTFVFHAETNGGTRFGA